MRVTIIGPVLLILGSISGQSGWMEASDASIQQRAEILLRSVGQKCRKPFEVRRWVPALTQHGEVYDAGAEVQCGRLKASWSEWSGVLRTYYCPDLRYPGGVAPVFPLVMEGLPEGAVPERPVAAETIKSRAQWKESGSSSRGRNRAIRRCEELLGISLGQNSEVGEVLTRDQALLVGGAWADRLGIANRADVRLRGPYHDAEDSTWGITWVRYAEDYEFEEEFVFLLITDVEGELIRVINQVTEAEFEGEVRILVEAAEASTEEAAKKFLSGVDSLDQYAYAVSVSGPVIEYVGMNRHQGPLPDKAWLKAHGPSLARPTLVYIGSADFEYVGPPDFHVAYGPLRVQISAETGDVIAPSMRGVESANVSE